MTKLYKSKKTKKFVQALGISMSTSAIWVGVLASVGVEAFPMSLAVALFIIGGVAYWYGS